MGTCQTNLICQTKQLDDVEIQSNVIDCCYNSWENMSHQLLNKSNSEFINLFFRAVRILNAGF